jgi:hypothetical protein
MDLVDADLAGLMSSVSLDLPGASSTRMMVVQPLERVERILIHLLEGDIDSRPFDAGSRVLPPLLYRGGRWPGSASRPWVDYAEAAPEQAHGIAEQFASLAAQWASETMLMSSIEAIVLNSAYQQIIGMGMAALPLILQELEREPAYWFWALAAIAREDPAVDAADFDDARERWLAWGRDRGLLVPQS